MAARKNKLGRFALAAIRHISKGMPTCTQEQINERLEICRSCEWFVRNHCVQCGCRCNSGKAFMNKLAWADEECPKKKWGKVDKDVSGS